MSSKTTLWRHRKFGTPSDGRGRNSNELRGERLAFVGAVVAQLVETGEATCHGLKTVGLRKGTVREGEIKIRLSLAMTYGDAPETSRLLEELQTESLLAECGDCRVEWWRPADDVWREIQAFTGNADCLALAVCEVLGAAGHLRYSARHASLRGAWHTDFSAKRNEVFSVADETGEPEIGGPLPSKTPWRIIEGMSKKTASFWKSSRRTEFEIAARWFVGLLKRHSAFPTDSGGASGMLRDDLADVLAGKVLKVPRTSTRAR